MSLFDAINVSGSGLTAQRLRMDIVASNVANADSTRATVNEDGEFEPYRRKMAVLEPNETSFKSALNRAQHPSADAGVQVSAIAEDDKPFDMVYEPSHPDADEAGYVQMPNVNPLQEMVDLMGATRSYEANITVLNASKSMLMKALEIGR